MESTIREYLDVLLEEIETYTRCHQDIGLLRIRLHNLLHDCWQEGFVAGMQIETKEHRYELGTRT